MPIFFFGRPKVSVLRTISFLEKVTMRTGAFKAKRIFVCGINQDPICFDMAVARWLPRSHEWMVSAPGRKWETFSKMFDNFLQLTQVLPSFPHALDIPGELRSLRDLFHFSQFLNMASKESNSSMSSPRRLFSRVETVSSFGIATGKGRPPRRDICL